MVYVLGACEISQLEGTTGAVEYLVLEFRGEVWAEKESVFRK